jgi:hypothetical protein
MKGKKNGYNDNSKKNSNMMMKMMMVADYAWCGFNCMPQGSRKELQMGWRVTCG